MSTRLPLLALLLLCASCSETPTDPFPDPPASTASLHELYDMIPAVAPCNDGSMTAGEKQKVMLYLKALRQLHGLRPVAYRSTDDAKTAKAALIITANKTRTHTPKSAMTCFSGAGL